jgi:hypothetical protein
MLEWNNQRIDGEINEDAGDPSGEVKPGALKRLDSYE